MDISQLLKSILLLIDIGVFPVFDYSDKAAVNIHVEVFVWTHVSISLKYFPSSGIAGSYGGNGNSIFSTSSPPLVIISGF